MRIPEPKVEMVRLDALRPWNLNPRKNHAVQQIARSIEAFGYLAPIVVQKDTMRVLAGHGRLAALKQMGVEEVPVVVADVDNDRAALYTMADNKLTELAEWDFPAMADLLLDFDARNLDVTLTGFSEAELERISTFAPRPEREGADDVPVLVEQAITEQGDVWELGVHKVRCGDGRDQRVVDGFFSGQPCPLMVSDPPYCSGGFQEAGRSAGTFGNIASDNLSTRGYVAMMKEVLLAARVQTCYLFTDWRMWMPLYDVVESSGIAVRSMIVWDKGSPGLGSLWRTQHELVMFASRTGSVREKGRPARGNVIQAQRTGNVNHYTEKPVSLIRELIRGDQASGRDVEPVYDPFAGSGTTLIACEDIGRQCFAVEIEPRFVDVIVRRWQKFTGKQARNLTRQDVTIPPEPAA